MRLGAGCAGAGVGAACVGVAAATVVGAAEAAGEFLPGKVTNILLPSVRIL